MVKKIRLWVEISLKQTPGKTFVEALNCYNYNQHLKSCEGAKKENARIYNLTLLDERGGE